MKRRPNTMQSKSSIVWSRHQNFNEKVSFLYWSCDFTNV